MSKEKRADRIVPKRQKTEGRWPRCGMEMDQRRREHGSKSKDGRLPNEAIGLIKILYL